MKACSALYQGRTLCANLSRIPAVLVEVQQGAYIALFVEFCQKMSQGIPATGKARALFCTARPHKFTREPQEINIPGTWDWGFRARAISLKLSDESFLRLTALLLPPCCARTFPCESSIRWSCSACRLLVGDHPDKNHLSTDRKPPSTHSQRWLRMLRHGREPRPVSIAVATGSFVCDRPALRF